MGARTQKMKERPTKVDQLRNNIDLKSKELIKIMRDRRIEETSQWGLNLFEIEGREQ